MAGTDLTRRMLLAALAAAPLAEAGAAQDTWPSRPVRVMVPYPPAGGADTTARIVYAKLSENLGQPFAIENRGGAGGTIGEAVIAKADPDGYAILHDATAFSVNGSLYQDLPFDYRRDFDPVILIGEVANILVATPSLPVTTVAEVIAYAKAQPDGIDMASSGNGTLAASVCSNCSPAAPASRSITSRIAAVESQSRTSWQARCHSCSPTLRRHSA